MEGLKKISSLLLMGFSGLIFVSSVSIGTGTLEVPGPGFIGCLASVLVFFLSLITLIKDFRTQTKADGATPSLTWLSLQKPLILSISLCCYTFFLGIIGYLVSTTLLTFIMLYAYYSKRWYSQMIIAALIVNVTYLVFNKWLGVQLPPGSLKLAW